MVSQLDFMMTASVMRVIIVRVVSTSVVAAAVVSTSVVAAAVVTTSVVS